MSILLLEGQFLANHTDEALAGALFDALHEQGKSELAARRRVNRLRRAASAARLLGRMREVLAAGGDKSGRLRGTIRGYCGLTPSTNVPIAVVDGDSAPAMTGEAPYHTFRGKKGREGGICHSPGAAIRAGYKVDYHPDTRRITVGCKWVAELIERGSVSRAT